MFALGAIFTDILKNKKIIGKYGIKSKDYGIYEYLISALLSGNPVNRPNS